MTHIMRAGAALLGALALPLEACDDGPPGVAGPAMPSAAQVATPRYTSISVNGRTYEIWPFTTGTLNTASPDDPVNLFFAGEGDPRAVRAALMALGPAAPLQCTWSDAVGDEQASAAATVGWTGSAIQLACGSFGPVRLHLRLFDIGDAVLAQAHFEVLIEGTDQHQVLSYSLAEDLVLNDLVRTGLADPAAITLTPQITPLTHRTIAALIFNALPDELQAFVTGASGDVTADVPISNGDGRLAVVPLAHYADAGTGSHQEFTLQYGQAVPKPFCQAPGDWVYVVGPVDIALTVTIAADGTLERHMRAEGRLSVTPIDVTVSPPAPTGAPYTANVTQDQQAWATDAAHWVQARLHQALVPSGGADRGQVTALLRVGTDVPDDYSRLENCGAVQP